MRVHPPRAGLLALAALAIATAAAACGSSGYQYVENDELGVYAKVPDDWTVYDEDAMFPDDTDVQRAQRLATSWTRTFDASEEPSVEHTGNRAATVPTGRIQVLRLNDQVRNQISLSGLRGIGAVGDPAADPLVVATQDPAVIIVRDEPVTFDGGFHGVRTVFRVDPSRRADAGTGGPEAAATDTTPFVVDQTTVLDATSSRAYIFQVSCSDDCYANTHKDAIADIVDSWTIQEVR